MSKDLNLLAMSLKKYWWKKNSFPEIRIIQEKIQKLKYVSKGSTHIPSILRAISPGVLNRFEILPRTNSIFILKGWTMSNLATEMSSVRWVYRLHLSNNRIIMESSIWKTYIVNEKEPEVNKKENRNIYFCVAYSHFLSKSIHRVTNK